MADERATPLNQGFDKWLQITDTDQLETWNGTDKMPALKESLGINDKASLSEVSVLQVVSASTSTEVVVNIDSYADSGLSATITPKSPDSKILVFVTQSVRLVVNTTDERHMKYRIRRNSTTVAERNKILGWRNINNLDMHAPLSLNIEDTPPISDPPVPITYKTQGHRSGNSTSVQFQNEGVSSIILMEVQ